MSKATTALLLNWLPVFILAMSFMGYLLYTVRQSRSYKAIAAQSVAAVLENTTEIRRLNLNVERLTSALMDRGNPVNGGSARS